MTVQEFVAVRYWPVVKSDLCPKWCERTEALLVMIIKSFGHYDIATIPIEAVDGWWGQLKARYRTPVTPNKCLVRAKHIFKTAIRWKMCIENPFLNLKRVKEREHKFTSLTKGEHAALLANASPQLQWYLVFAYYTGARRSSLAKLEERDIDFSRNQITFRETKNGDDYTIPIHDELRPWCMKAVTGAPNRRLLPQYKNMHSISSLFRRLMKRNGLKGFRFHDFRHNVGTKLAEAGYDVKVRMDMLGHKDPRMCLKYTHISQQTLESALKEAL